MTFTPGCSALMYAAMPATRPPPPTATNTACRLPRCALESWRRRAQPQAEKHDTPWSSALLSPFFDHLPYKGMPWSLTRYTVVQAKGTRACNEQGMPPRQLWRKTTSALLHIIVHWGGFAMTRLRIAWQRTCRKISVPMVPCPATVSGSS